MSRGGATVAAARQLRDSGRIRKGERMILLNTSSGIKYPEVISVSTPQLARDGRISGP